MAKLPEDDAVPHHKHVKIEGRITDVFAHRFVIECVTGQRLLADLGPKNADAFPLKEGLEVSAEGEMKPSELKVERIARKGKAPIVIEHKKKHDHHEDADAEIATRAVTDAGFELIGAARRKPKHFEVLARKGGHFFECHVEFDGHIRKEKPIDENDDKWSSDLKHAA